MKFSLLNFDQSLSKIFDLLEEGFERISGANKNRGKWSEIVAVRSPDIILLESILGDVRIQPTTMSAFLVLIISMKVDSTWSF